MTKPNSKCKDTNTVKYKKKKDNVAILDITLVQRGNKESDKENQ